jgi:signal transduction histidine kinase
VAATDAVPIRRLLEVGRALVSDLDMPAILERVLSSAREITGARYAALGVLSEGRERLEEFLVQGIDERGRAAIGEEPRGRGVLGVLISDPRPLRLDDVSGHPRSYGFPEGHPPMRSFLGVPIVIRGRAWGNLYLAEKQGAKSFTSADEEAVVILADLAAVAIENARLYAHSEERRRQLERAIHGLEATRDVSIAIGGETGSERVLELIAKRSRDLVNARAVLIMLCDGPDLVVVASAGYAEDARGHRLPIADSSSGEVLKRGVPERIAQVGARLRIAPAELGIPDAHTALLVPMLHRGTPLGVLAAFDRGEAGEPFSGADEDLLRTFGASAANAIAISRSVESERLRASLAAADAERSRWARELHDDTLQIFGGLRVLLASTLRRADPVRYEPAIGEAIEEISQGIEGLRAIISDLRPAALDEIGLRPALDALLDRRNTDTLKIISKLDLPSQARGDPVLDPELETTVYRIVQEALTNVAKHSAARTAWVTITTDANELTILVRDDGAGFDTSASTSGYGLAGMGERVYLVGGTLTVSSDSATGTTIRAVLPLRPSGRALRRGSEAPPAA